MKTIGVIVIALAMLIALTGIVMADHITTSYSSPGYCSIVQAGSTYDLTVGSVVTSTDNRFVSTDITAPVVVNYAINVKPYSTSQGQIAASGSVMAYIKAHLQEARVNGTQKAEGLTYNEQSGAQGTITSFQKVIAYQSVKSLL
jgi:hypothetical protein